jgi:hypothetical protein
MFFSSVGSLGHGAVKLVRAAGGPRAVGIGYHLHADDLVRAQLLMNAGPVVPTSGGLRPGPDTLSPSLRPALGVRFHGCHGRAQAYVLALAGKGAGEVEVGDPGNLGDLLEVGGPDKASALTAEIGGDNGDGQDVLTNGVADLVVGALAPALASGVVVDPVVMCSGA